MIQTGTVIAGRYRILREIGRGGMSVVYLADDIRLNKQWAVKESKKTDSSVKNRVITSSLITEVNMLKRLRHPALPQIVDILDDDDTVAIVMDYVEGESLSSLVKREGPQSQENVTEWAIQLCDVLSYLHNQQPRPVIYRDMKPSNVMLRPDGTVAILDLGIAREYKEYNTNDTTVLGTRGYAPPEQYVGQTDARSDIYALGMTMRHLLAGVDPSFLDTGAPLSQHGVTVSREMEAILKKCTQPAAENRYQSCQELYGDLLKLRKLLEKQRRANEKKLTRQQKQEEPKPPKEPKPPREKPVKTGGKSKVPAIIAAVLALVLVIGFTGFSLLRNKGRHDDYEALIGISSATALQDKIESYEQAIELCPQRPEAYIKILEAYEDEADIIFGQAESAQFLALYDTNRDLFDPAARETAELNYKAGRMFFNYYGGVDGAFSTKIQKAYSFFLANKENTELSPEFKEKTLSDCYYEICSFYKKYILSNVVEEPSLADYEDLISTLENAIDSVKTAGAYDKLTLYKGTFVLLFDQCDEMANVNIDKQTVLDLFDEVYQEAKALSVNKEQAKKLQEEIVSHYDSYREIIERTFDR